MPELTARHFSMHRAARRIARSVLGRECASANRRNRPPSPARHRTTKGRGAILKVQVSPSGEVCPALGGAGDGLAVLAVAHKSKNMLRMMAASHAPATFADRACQARRHCRNSDNCEPCIGAIGAGCSIRRSSDCLFRKPRSRARGKGKATLDQLHASICLLELSKRSSDLWDRAHRASHRR